jgi:poly-gamma-glutamate synthesis protein (capsule biosynthesis protein)
MAGLQARQQLTEGAEIDAPAVNTAGATRRRLALNAALTALALVMLTATSVARSQASTLTITLAGQAMLRSDLRATVPSAVARIRSLLQGDVIFTNLESTVAEPGQAVHAGAGFLTPPEALDALQAMGFNLLALASNHAFDLQVTGITNSLHEADRRHLVHAGTGSTLAQAAAPAYLHTAQGTVALVASASGAISPDARASASQPGVNELRVEAGTQQNEGVADLPAAPPNQPDEADARRILDSIREAHRHADLVVVYQHNHVFGNLAFNTLFNEGMPERLRPDEWLVNWTHREIDAGADIVVMHGAPLLHGVEIYHGRPIFYDLGNFIFNVPPTMTAIVEPMTWESVTASVQFAHGVLQSVSFQPLVLNDLGAGEPDVHNQYTSNQFLLTRGLPRLAVGARAHYILDRLASLSRAFNTRIQVLGEHAQIELPTRPSAAAPH